MSRLFFVFLLVAAPASAQDIPADSFVLWGWQTPPLTDADLSLYHSLGMNTIGIPNETTSQEGIRLAEKNELAVMLRCSVDLPFEPDKWVKFANAHPNVKGWLLQESAHLADAALLSDRIKALRSLDPKRLPLVTLPSSDAGPEWGASLASLVRAGNAAIGYHRYWLNSDGSNDDTDFHRDLEATRRVSVETRVPLFGIVQASQRQPYRMASESDIRYQAYCFLACGAKGLCFDVDWDRDPKAKDKQGFEAMANPRTRYSWEAVSRLSKEIDTLTPLLLDLTSEDVFFVGKPISGLAELPFGKKLIANVEAEQAMLGFLRDSQGRTWVALVNRRHAMQKSSKTQKSTMRVIPHKDVARIVEIDRITGFEKEVPFEEGSFIITIPGGTGSLMRIETNGI